MTLLLQILAVLAFLTVWGFIIMGMVMNAQVWWIALHAKEGDQIPSGVTFVFDLPGARLVLVPATQSSPQNAPPSLRAPPLPVLPASVRPHGGAANLRSRR